MQVAWIVLGTGLFLGLVVMLMLLGLWLGSKTMAIQDDFDERER